MKITNKITYGTTIKQQTNNKQITTNKNDKNIKNDKKIRNINIPNKKFFAEFVSLTEEEYKQLEIKFGKQFTDRCIEVLDNYKGSKGKEYKSDYRAILTWVVDKVSKEYKSKTAEEEFLNG